jgi:long-chain acyl-CoA synthetase
VRRVTRIEDLLIQTARRHPDQTGIRDAERVITWSGLLEESVALARKLAVAPEDRVVAVGRNRITIAAATFACALSSAVLVPLNTRLLPAELDLLITRSGATVVLADSNIARTLTLPDACRGIALDDSVPGWSRLDELAPAPAVRPAGGADEVAVQMYTSGTTGLPKGAMLTHANFTAMTESWLRELPLRSPADTFLQVTPLYHVGAQLMLLSCVATGARLLLHPEFSPTNVARTLAHEGVTHTLLVPAMIRWLLDDPATSDLSFPDLKMVVYGAAPIPVDQLRRARARFGCAFLQGYGLTESAGVLTVLRPADHEGPEHHLASAGRPVAGVEVRLVSDGRDVALGEVGEILARGPNVFVGYHDLPDATAETLRDGWLHTGDLAMQDGEGFVTIVDRSKDMILVGGENVYPREVEDVLRTHPLVSDVTVIGIPHETWGESVLALVVPAGEVQDAGAAGRLLVRHTRERLARFKCPSRVSFVSELPRNAAGKVLKAQLRAPWLAGRDRRV